MTCDSGSWLKRHGEENELFSSQREVEASSRGSEKGSPYCSGDSSGVSSNTNSALSGDSRRRTAWVNLAKDSPEEEPRCRSAAASRDSRLSSSTRKSDRL